MQLFKTERSQLFPMGKPVSCEYHSDIKLIDINDFNSWKIFQMLSVDADWLKKPVAEWENDENYKEVERFVSELNVTNDCSERAIKLITNLAPTVQKEDQLQAKIQSIELHRKSYRDFTKCSLRK